MKQIIKVVILFILFTISVYAQNGAIKGVVINSDTKSGLANVNIVVSVAKHSTVTNGKGYFYIKNVEKGNFTLTISSVGFKSVTKEVNVNNDLVDLGTVELTPIPINLGEITVSSTKFDKQLKDVSIPMVVLTNDDFKTKNNTTLVDLLKNEPGLNLGRDGIWGTRLNIRGFSKETVVTLIDGNRVETANNIAASLSLVDPSAIERVEVIKGSSSSLYGTGAVGGVINIITNKNLFSGNFNYGGSYSTGYNSVNKGISNSLSLNAGSDNWFAKVSGTYRNAKDTETPMGTLKDSRFKDNSVFATFGFRPIENHEFILDYQLFNAKDVGIPGGASLPSTASARYPDEKRELYSFNYKTYNLFSNLATLEFKTFYQLIKRNVEVIPNATTIMNPRADHYTTGALLQSNWVFGDNHLIIGIDAWQRRYQGSRERYLSNVKRTIYDKPIPDAKYRSIGLFTQDEFKALDDNLTLTVGARIDQINVKNDAVSNPVYMINNGNYNYNPPKTPGASFAAGDKSDLSWSANFAAIYKLNNYTDLTLNLARSFRAAALEERFQYIDLGGVVYLGNPDLDPENGYYIDLGTRFWMNNFNLKLNLFVNYVNNYIIDNPVVKDSLYVKDNVSKARIYGFDLSFEYEFIKSFVFYGSASYVRGEDTEQDLDLPEIPPLNGKLGLRSNYFKFVTADFVANIYDNQTDGKISVDPNKWQVHTPGYVTYDLFVNSIPLDLMLAKLTLSAGVENITNRAYRNSLATNRGIIKLEPGRNYFVKVSLNW